MAQTSLILQIIAIAIYLLAIIFLVIAAGLFSDAFRCYNKENTQLETKEICKNNINPNNSNCNFAFTGEVLAALGLVILVILSIVKIVRGLIGNKIIFIVEVSILSFSGIFAFIFGWAVTCDTINDLGKAPGTGINCNYDNYLKQVTASVVFTFLAVAAIVGSSILTILIAVFGLSKTKDDKIINL